MFIFSSKEWFDGDIKPEDRKVEVCDWGTDIKKERIEITVLKSQAAKP